MKTIVLVKQVPRPDAIEFNPETKSLKREGVPVLLNPFDATAVVAARRLGGEVVAMTMGPPPAAEALRQCLALGADRAIHLSDRVFAVADTIGTSRTLALAIRKEGADVVVCGRKTVDSETWQVPPEVAAFLGWPHLTSVVDLELDTRILRATRETDEGFEVYEVEPPVVVSLAHAHGEDASATRDGQIDTWGATDLVDDLRESDKRFGQTGSPTRVLAVRDVTPPRAGERLRGADRILARVRELLEERRPDPTAWEKPERLGDEPGASYDAWTFVECFDGRASRASLELLAKGRELAGKLGGANVALAFVSRDGDALARTLAEHGADRVVLAEDERFTAYHPEVWSSALAEALRKLRPHTLAIPATANGRDFGPRAAGELELGMTGDCVNLGIDRAGRLVQTKPAYGGNIVSVIMGATTPQLATVRPRMFPPLERHRADAQVERLVLEEAPPSRLRVVERRAAPAYDLDEAELVVVRGPDGRADGLAADGVAVGGTREVCASGALPWNRHVGLYGRQVAPRVVVAIDGGDGMNERADVVGEADPHEVVQALAGA